MDGQIIEFDPALNGGAILGEDRRRYEFARTEWHSAGEPERGRTVRFVANDDRATHVYLLFPSQPSPLAASEAIEAVYRTALGRAGSEDLFAAPVRWTSFIAPALILVALRLLQLLFAGDLAAVLRQAHLTFLTGLLVLAVIVIALLIGLAIAVGVAALIGRGVGQPGRVGSGVLAFVWAQAVLLQPGIAVLRLLLDPQDPTAVIVLLVVAMIVLVIGTGRAVSAGFQSGGAGSGVFIVIAAGVVSWLADKLLGAFS
jgi:hypothetical protein